MIIAEISPGLVEVLAVVSFALGFAASHYLEAKLKAVRSEVTTTVKADVATVATDIATVKAKVDAAATAVAADIKKV
jgi:hypothetical protein